MQIFRHKQGALEYRKGGAFLLRGFSVIEIIATIAIISILIVATTSLINNNPTQAKRSALGLVKSALVTARSKAISSGEYTAVVFVGYQDGPEYLRGRSVGLFRVTKDETTSKYEQQEQHRRWVILPKGVVFLDPPSVKESAQNPFLIKPEHTFTIYNSERNSRQKTRVHALIFSPMGSIDYPSGSGEIELQLGAGIVKNGRLLTTGGSTHDPKKNQALLVSRLTGRTRTLDYASQ